MALYKERTKRITFDVPVDLKILIHEIIPPSTLSAIMRNLLFQILHLKDKKGTYKTINALLNNKVKLIITEENNET